LLACVFANGTLVMADRRLKKGHLAARRNLAFETLDSRALLATLFVGGAQSQFGTVQAAVNTAAPNDVIQIAATQAGFAESVDLSLMGTARGAPVTGNLTITGELAANALIVPAGTTAQNSTAFYNSAPFNGNLKFDRLTIRPTSNIANEGKGIRLQNVIGDITVTNSQVQDATYAGIEISNSGGAGGAQSRLTIESVDVSRNLEGATPFGVRLTNVNALGLIDHVSITESNDGVTIDASGATKTSLTFRDVDIDGWNDTFHGNDAVRVVARDTSNVVMAFSFCDFNDLPGNSIDASSFNSAQLSINVYEHTVFGDTDPDIVHKFISGTVFEPSVKFVSNDTSVLSVALDDNIFNTVPADGVIVQALNTSVMNANIHDNQFSSVATGLGQRAITIKGNSAANATINANVSDNVIFDVSGAGLRVQGDGASTYNVIALRNSVSYSVTPDTTVAGLNFEGVGGNPAKFNLAIRDNSIDNVATGIKVTQPDGGVAFKVEYTTGGTIGNLRQYLEANNFGSTASASINFTAPANVQVAIGTFLPRVPMRLGDYVWSDTNKNGVQENNENAVGGVLMTLTGTETTSGRAISQNILTDGDHGYLFGALLPGTYTVSLVPPAGFDLTGRFRKTTSTTDVDTDFDSDFRQGIRQATATLAGGVDNMALDAGLIPTDGKLWKNQINQYDVNDDGFVTPLDALLVIIDLNAAGPRSLGTPTVTSTPSPFVDVNGDNAVAPLDALLVIIRLNAGGVGEGEATEEETFAPLATAPAASTSSDSTAATSSGYPAYVPPQFFYPSASTSNNNAADDSDDSSALDAFFADY
jgi:hypothetical protein